MTREELLTPRWKVIADFPFNKHYPVGKIIIDNGKDPAKNENGHDVFPCEWDTYPHIFKKLLWHERNIEDLPKYVVNKASIPNVIIPVTWVREEVVAMGGGMQQLQLFAVRSDIYINMAPTDAKSFAGYYYPYSLMPATEEEYNEFIKLQAEKLN